MSDLTTIQGGTNYGGCDNRIAGGNVLDQWHTEAIDSLVAAVDGIEVEWRAQTKKGKLVAQALNTFFKVPISNTPASQMLIDKIASTCHILSSGPHVI